MKIFKITILSCSRPSLDRSTRVRSNDLTVDSTFTTDWGTEESSSWSILRDYGQSTVDRAVAKMYGKRCYFQQNHGMPLGYGQIFKPCKTGGSTSVTGSIRVEVSL